MDIEGKFGDRAFFGHGENISANGMFMKTEDIFTTGDQIYFSFFLPGGLRVRVRGEIVRLMKQAPASMFADMEFDLRTSLRRTKPRSRSMLQRNEARIL